MCVVLICEARQAKGADEIDVCRDCDGDLTLKDLEV